MHRPSLPRLRSALVLAFVAVLALSACSRRESSHGSVGRCGCLRRGLPRRRAAARLLPEHHPRRRAGRRGQGLFQQELGSTKLVPTKFNAGPEAVGALLGGSLDAAFIGSGPAINAYAKSNGEAVRLIAGATSGGAQLVVKPDITKPEDLVGKTVVTPQLGNTQDVSLKKWLKEKNLTGKVGR